MLPLRFIGGAERDFLAHPRSVLKVAGQELMAIQFGMEPSDWKPMPTIGPGVKEIRVWVAEGTFRVIYVVKSQKGVFVLHSFTKKTQQTPKREIELARSRLKEVP
jgi:phage-related protein